MTIVLPINPWANTPAGPQPPSVTNWSKVGFATRTGSTSQLMPAIPAGVAEGDLFVCGLMLNSSGAVFGWPGDWTEVWRLADVTANRLMTVGVVVRGASDPSMTTTGSTATRVSALGVYRQDVGGVDTGDLVYGIERTTGANVSNSGLTTGQNDCLLCSFYFCSTSFVATAFRADTDPTGSSGTTTNTATNPARGAWLRRSAVSTTSGDRVSVVMADAVKATPGNTGTIRCTGINNNSNFLASLAFSATP